MKVGSYRDLQPLFFGAIANTTRYHMNHPEIPYKYTDCGIPTRWSFNLFRPANDPALPWTGITLGLTVSAVWYWCSDQVCE